MPGLFSEFLTDKTLEVEGREFVYTAGDGDPLFKVRLARVGGANKKYDQVRERVTSPYRRLKTLTDEMQSQIAYEVFAEAIVVPNTWETYDRTTKSYKPGIEQADGLVLPATVENIIATVKKLPDLYAMLLGEALNIDNYKAVALEEDAKN